MQAQRLTRSVVLAILASAMLAQSAVADLMAHPASVRTGSCAEVGDVVGPLSDVVGEAIGGPAMGSTTAIAVESSSTPAVPVSHARVLSLPHSVVVARGPGDDDRDAYIACGDIGGHQMTATDLAIGLAGVDDSGYSGIATIHDNGDGTVGIAIYLTSAGAPASDAAATPVP